jgi:RsiW-degrading membrane proteinase PrsW (M82 family)
MVNIFQYIVVLIFSFLPAFVWLAFFLKSDPHPEPKKKIAFTFLFGILSTIPALFFEYLVFKTDLFFRNIFLFMFFVALFEEIFKFLGAFFANKKNLYFDEPLDAMIYMISAALGFATVENLLLVVKELPFMTFYTFFDALNIISLRFIGATLLHALSSALLGYYWALSHFKKEKRKIIWGFLCAIFSHFIFNTIALKNNNPSFASIFFLVVIAFFVIADFEKLRKN